MHRFTATRGSSTGDGYWGELAGSAQLANLFQDDDDDDNGNYNAMGGLLHMGGRVCAQCEMPIRGDVCSFCGHVNVREGDQYGEDDVPMDNRLGGMTIRTSEVLRGPIREQMLDSEGRLVDQDLGEGEAEQQRRLHLQRMLLNDEGAVRRRERRVAPRDRTRSGVVNVVEANEVEAFFDGMVLDRTDNGPRADSHTSGERSESGQRQQEQHIPTQPSFNMDWFSQPSQMSYMSALSQGIDAYVSSVDASMKLVRDTRRPDVPPGVQQYLQNRLDEGGSKKSGNGLRYTPRNFQWLNNFDTYSGVNLWNYARELGIDIGSQNVVDIIISNKVLSFLYCYQVILMVMVQDLVDRLHFPPATVQIMQQLWQRYLDQFDPVAASNIWTFKMRDSREFEHLIPLAEDTLAFCYLACFLSGKTVLLADVVRWAQRGDIAYRNVCFMLEQNVPLWRSCALRCIVFTDHETSQRVNLRHESGYRKEFKMPSDLHFSHIMSRRPLPDTNALWERIRSLHCLLYPERGSRGRIVDSEGIMHRLCRDVLCLPKCNLRDSIVSLSQGLLSTLKQGGHSLALQLTTFSDDPSHECLISAAIIFTMQLCLGLDMEDRDPVAKIIWHEIITRMVSVFHAIRIERGGSISELAKPSHGLRRYQHMDDIFIQDFEYLSREFTASSANAMGYRGTALESFVKALIGSDAVDSAQENGEDEVSNSRRQHWNSSSRSDGCWWLRDGHRPLRRNRLTASSSQSNAISEKILNHPHDLRSFRPQNALLIKPNVDVYNAWDADNRKDVLSVDLRQVVDKNKSRTTFAKVRTSWQQQHATSFEKLPPQLGVLVESMAYRIRIKPGELSACLALLMERQLGIPNNLRRERKLPESALQYIDINHS